MAIVVTVHQLTTQEPTRGTALYSGTEDGVLVIRENRIVSVASAPIEEADWRAAVDTRLGDGQPYGIGSPVAGDLDSWTWTPSE
jgi:imidazolonepropionase-like amidohydrolase